MRSRDPFFQSRSEWAKYKHVILKKYLRVWVYKLASRSDHLAFIDTCAGEGTYGDGEPGSPLIAAAFNESYLEPRGQRLLVIACESRRHSADQLRLNLERYTSADPPQAIVVQDSFVNSLPRVLDMTKDMPTLLFIDPYGMRDLTAENLRPLLKDRDREPTEVLVRVPPNLLARFAGWLKERERSAQGRKVADSFRKLLDDLRIDPELLGRVARGGEENPVGANEFLLSYLEMFDERFRFVEAIPIRETYDALPKYYLVHGTDNEHGLVHMNDIVSKAEDDLFDETEKARQRGQISLFEAPKRTPRVTIEDAEDRILYVLREFYPLLSYIGIRAQLVHAFGPDLREKDHKRAIRNLETRRLILPVKEEKKLEWRKYRLAPGAEN
jgi:three-Cys-motif partner protein